MSSAAPLKTERLKVLKKANELTAYNDFPEAEFAALVAHCQKKIAENEKNEPEKKEWVELLKKIQYLETNAQPKYAHLDRYPEEIIPVVPGAQLTFGDTHGNALKMIHFLITHGVLTLKNGSEDYKKLFQIYVKQSEHKEWDKADIDNYNDIINRATVNPKANVRFIGDELGDRGANDYFTLKILKKLKDGHVKTEHLISDHGAEFLDFHSKGCQPGYKAPHLKGGQARSVENLSKWIEKGLVTKQEVQELGKVYTENLKVISYTLDEANNHITFFSHAPVGVETLRHLAKEFGVPFKEGSAKEVAETIDGVNLAFNEKLKKNEILPLLEKETEIRHKKGISSSDATYDTPLTRVLWVRYPPTDPEAHYKGDTELIEQQAKTLNYNITNCHGHDGAGRVPIACRQKVKNIDDRLGRADHLYTDFYKVHCNFETGSKLKLAAGLESKETKDTKERKEVKDDKETKETKSTVDQTYGLDSLNQAYQQQMQAGPPAGATSTVPMLSSTQSQVNRAQAPAPLTAAGQSQTVTQQNIQTAFDTSIKLLQNLKTKNFNIESTELAPGSNKNDLKIKLGYKEPKTTDEITRKIDPENQTMKATLSKNANDSSYFLFFEMNQAFQPLKMSSCGTPESVIKVLEASLLRNTQVELSEADKKMFMEGGQASPALKKHYQLLTEHPKIFIEKTQTEPNRPLGKPFEAPPTLRSNL